VLKASDTAAAVLLFVEACFRDADICNADDVLLFSVVEGVATAAALIALVGRRITLLPAG
jgi:hypothetical protein